MAHVLHPPVPGGRAPGAPGIRRPGGPRRPRSCARRRPPNLGAATRSRPPCAPAGSDRPRRSPHDCAHCPARPVPGRSAARRMSRFGPGLALPAARRRRALSRSARRGPGRRPCDRGPRRAPRFASRAACGPGEGSPGGGRRACRPSCRRAPFPVPSCAPLPPRPFCRPSCTARPLAGAACRPFFLPLRPHPRPLAAAPVALPSCRRRLPSPFALAAPPGRIFLKDCPQAVDSLRSGSYQGLACCLSDQTVSRPQASGQDKGSGERKAHTCPGSVLVDGKGMVAVPGGAVPPGAAPAARGATRDNPRPDGDSIDTPPFPGPPVCGGLFCLSCVDAIGKGF
jgi:hypothetical protein